MKKRYLVAGCVCVCAITVFPLVVWFKTNESGYSLTGAAYHQVRGPLTGACQAFKRDTGCWPVSLDELLQKNAKGGPYLKSGSLIDSWGNRYQYDAKGPMNKGVQPDIWFIRPEAGTKLGNWQ